LFTVLVSGFSAGTLVLRIAWATRQHNIRLAGAANIFVNAGVLVIYIVNLVLVQRILRAKQPRIGWDPVLRVTYKILYYTIGVVLAMVNTAVVISIYTLNHHTQQICRDIQLAALTYLLIFTCLPLIHVLVVVLLPTSPEQENFGQGSIRSKMILVTMASCPCMLLAGFKAGTTWSPPRPATNPQCYDSKVCFYVFNFTLEILILYVLTFGRIDKWFWVPNGSNQGGDYTTLKEQMQENDSFSLDKAKRGQQV
jgi:hypothetical protein